MGVALIQTEFDALLGEHLRWNDGEGGRRLDLTGRSLTGLRLAGRRVDGAGAQRGRPVRL